MFACTTGKDGSKLLDEQLSKFSEVAKEKTAQVRMEACWLMDDFVSQTFHVTTAP